MRLPALLLLAACAAAGVGARSLAGAGACACTDGCLQDANGWFCYVPKWCPGATPSVQLPHMSWIPCQPAAGAGATAAATASAQADVHLSGSRHHAPAGASAHASVQAFSSGGSAVATATAVATAGGGGAVSPHHWAPVEPATGGATATADASAVALGCGLAQAVATATATASGVLGPQYHAHAAPQVLQLSASAYAQATALATSPGCLASHLGFGCALAEAVASAQVSGWRLAPQKAGRHPALTAAHVCQVLTAAAALPPLPAGGHGHPRPGFRQHPAHPRDHPG